MKQMLSFVLAVLLLFSVSGLVLSATTKTETTGKDAQSATMAAPAAQKNDMVKPQEKMKGIMSMPFMMGKSMVATDDGGIVVMVGNKLMKFDQDLNLVKETEIKIDMEGMGQMMQNRGMPPMMNKPAQESAAGQGCMKEGEAKQEAPAKK